MFNQYPYLNENDLNLDYILATIKKLKEIMDEFVTLNTITFADPIIWDISTQYPRNTVVLDTAGNAYLSKLVVPAGVQLNNGDYWLEIFNFTEYTRTANQNLTVNVETNTTRATAAYNVDDWLIWNDVLYKVTVAIAIDDALVIGANIVHFTVEDFIKAFMTWATNTIQQYKNDIDASELQYRQQLAGDIANTTATLQAQLNAAIAGATVDSEVINARIGAVAVGSVTYSTLGEAIRSQIDYLNTALKIDNNLNVEKAINLINFATLTNNKYIDYRNGNLLNLNNYYVTDFIDITGISHVYTNALSQQLALFDAGFQFVEGYATFGAFRTAINNGTLNANDKYVRLTIKNDELSLAVFCREENGYFHTWSDGKYHKVKNTALSNDVELNNLKGGGILPCNYVQFDNYSGSTNATYDPVKRRLSYPQGTTVYVNDSLISNFSTKKYGTFKVGDKFKLCFKISTNMNPLNITYNFAYVDSWVGGGNQISDLNSNVFTKLIDLGGGHFYFEKEFTLLDVADFRFYLMLKSFGSGFVFDKEYYLEIEELFITSGAMKNYEVALIDETAVTILEVGADKKYSTITAALADCWHPSKHHRYEIKFYGDGSVYDTNTETGGHSIVVPNYVKICGVGDKTRNIIKLALTNPSTIDSVFDLYETAELENLTVWGVNTRYAVHDDFYENTGGEKTIKNCHFISDNGVYDAVYGAGFRSGAHWKFENCIFEQRTPNKCAFGLHNNIDFTEMASVKFIDCRFKGSYTRLARFGSITTNSPITNLIEMIGCGFETTSGNKSELVFLFEENYQTLGQGIRFNLIGYGNNIDNDNVTINNHDGVDYSNNVDLI